MSFWKYFAVSLAIGTIAPAADWGQFRGPNGGVVAEGALPEVWSKTENIAWTAKIPGSGWAQPVVVGKTVFVLTAVTDPPFIPKNMMNGVRDPNSTPKGDAKAFAPGPDIKIDWQVMALDLGTGQLKWTKTAATGKPKYAIHPSNSYATETPCADSERVYAFFGVAGIVIAYDHTGKEVWKKDVGAFPGASNLGIGASPTLFEDKLFVPLLNEEQATVLALDAKTGKQLYAIKREKPGTSWATPFVWKNSKRTELVICGKGKVSGHDLKTGDELWEFNNIDSSFSSSPAATDDVIAFGNGGPGSKSPLIFVQAGAKGDISLKEGQTANASVVLFKAGAAPGMASPLAAGEFVYILNNNRLSCYEAKSGAQKYKESIPKLGTIAASPVLADGKIYILDEAGKLAVVKAGSEFEVLRTNIIDDLFWSSPTPAGGKLLLRGVKELYCIGKN